MHVDYESWLAWHGNTAVIQCWKLTQHDFVPFSCFVRASELLYRHHYSDHPDPDQMYPDPCPDRAKHLETLMSAATGYGVR